MKYDIGDLLNSWPFDPDEFIARRITARDGLEKIQIRIDMGMLQLDVLGRPDGHRPHGAESLLHHYQAALPKSSNRGARISFKRRGSTISAIWPCSTWKTIKA
jgi:hypothetical protein